MKYSDLHQNLNRLRVFSTQDILLWDQDFRLANLDRWQEEGKLIQLKRGWYLFADTELKELDSWLIANRIYQPSYISLESALAHYGVIPEAVRQVTSVTTNKTAQFENQIGVFNYYSVKESLNFGYTLLESDDQNIKIAYLEKAILDMIYLRADLKSPQDFSEMRLNIELLNQKLDFDRLSSFVIIFDSPKIENAIQMLKEYLNA